MMAQRARSWAVVLAAGEGSRLHGLTRNSKGVVVPKQFCSLQGGPSLLQEAIQRSLAVAPLQRVCTVVAVQHRHWWQRMLSYLPEQNVIAQPHNRGTAHGILLPLLRIAAQDPDAVVVFLPSDHYIADEGVFASALRQAATLASTDEESLYLLGTEPDQADPELGYIVPTSRSRAAPSPVLRFVEKPTPVEAMALLEQGGLWNVFVLAASVRALLRLFAETLPGTLGAMSHLGGHAVENMYRNLPTVDFSRDILQGREQCLQVVAVPQCGWTDLGTPPRIASTLQRLEEVRVGPARRTNPSVHLNLAAQYQWLQHHGATEQSLGRSDSRA
jgi:mannose-1-phosphate guanylyltransferase